MKDNIAITVITGVVCLGLGFWGGKTLESKGRVGQPNIGAGGNEIRMGDTTQRSPRMGQIGAPGSGVNMTRGEVVELDDNSVVVKMTDGSSKIVFISSATKVNKSTEVAKEEIQSGDTVSIFGTKNDDGSITASDIQIGQLSGGMGIKPMEEQEMPGERPE